MAQEDAWRKLYDAAAQGNLDTSIRNLLSPNQSSDINFISDDSGQTPLHAACSGGHLQVVEYLVAKGADVTLRAENGDQAIHFVGTNGCKSDAVAIMRVLLDKDHDMIDAASHYRVGRTCLHLAAENGNGELVKYLLDQKADAKIKDYLGNTACDLVNTKSPGELLEAFLAFVHKEVDGQPGNDYDSYKFGKWGTTNLYKCRQAGVSAHS